jgi:hypothetical protein
VIVPVGADGKVDLTNASPGTTDLVADVVGYFRSQGGDDFTPMTPVRPWTPASSTSRSRPT